jgi:hypothetical protein
MQRLNRAHLVSLLRIRPSVLSMLMQRAMGEEAMQMGAAFDPHSALRLGAYRQGPPILQTLLRQRLQAQQQVTPCSHNVTRIWNSVLSWQQNVSKRKVTWQQALHGSAIAQLPSNQTEGLRRWQASRLVPMSDSFCMAQADLNQTAASAEVLSFMTAAASINPTDTEGSLRAISASAIGTVTRVRLYQE